MWNLRQAGEWHGLQEGDQTLEYCTVVVQRFYRPFQVFHIAAVFCGTSYSRDSATEPERIHTVYSKEQGRGVAKDGSYLLKVIPFYRMEISWRVEGIPIHMSNAILAQDSCPNTILVARWYPRIKTTAAFLLRLFTEDEENGSAPTKSTFQFRMLLAHILEISI